MIKDKNQQIATILQSYIAYSTLLNHLDNQLHIIANLSMIEDVFSSINRIEIIRKKQDKLINFKYRVDKSIKNLTKQEIYILKEYFINNVTIQYLSELLHVSIRTAFRYVDKTVNKFMNCYKGDDND